jgi:FAD/FMN-containing dehydrogenase
MLAQPFISTALIAVENLKAQIRGEVFLPGDEGYEQAKFSWNVAVQHQPAVIVVPESTEDVVAAVRFAREAGLGVAVQATGHGTVRVSEDNLLIVTSKLTGLRIDTTGRTAWIAAGLKWGEVLEEAQEFGLTPLLGSSTTVGAVGYTLGGGMGWLARKYGMAIDSVRAFEVVTAAGTVVRASKDENADLFWGLQGSGGSLGIVTAMEIDLYPVAAVYGGNLYYPAAMAKEVITRYREWIASAPEELTSSISIMNFPPLPQLPEFMRGQSFVIVRGAYVGALEEGEALLRYWREWRSPLVDDFGVLPFNEADRISNDPKDPVPVLSTGAWLHDLSDDAIDILVERAITHNGLIKAEIRHAGGAIASVPAHVNAYSHRDAELILQMVSITPTPDAKQAAEIYMDDIKAALAHWLTGSIYMNFVEGKESQKRVADGYSADAYERLVALKTQYDPTNLFGYSFNIRPN